MSSFDSEDYPMNKAIKLDGVVYYSQKTGGYENHWDILARVVKELRASIEEQTQLLADIDADKVTIEFGYPAKVIEVPEGFTTIDRNKREYTETARNNLGIAKPPVPACNCNWCREARVEAAKEKETEPLVLGQTGPI